MALTSWKPLRFFDVSPVRLHDRDGVLSLDKANISSLSAGTHHILVGTPVGDIHQLDQTFKACKTWRAHEAGSVTHVHQVANTAWLISLSENSSQEPELKVWALDQTEKRTGSPKLLSTLTVQNGRRNFPVTALAFTTNLAQLAVGFGNGTVTVIRGDLIHDRGTKQRTVFDNEEPITGLEFREGNATALYIATTSKLLSLAVSGRQQGAPARSLDSIGCAIDCMTLDTQSNEIVVARDDAIYAYGPKGKAASYAFEGSKKLVRVIDEYVVLVSPPKNNLTRSRTLQAFGGIQASAILNTTTFTILNTDLKFIAHSEALDCQVNDVFTIWGDIFLLATDGKLFRYHEKSFQQKIEILLKGNLFVLAISLAQKYKADAVQQNIIFRRYGDFLYQKGDFDTAMQQYLRAIENTEPSQVIRKYLDNQRIRNLIDYLEELHEHGRATSDHTILLLNCYAKLKDVDKLEEFIKQPGELKFDLDTAVLMCRQGGYYDQAAFLARRHEEHSLVVAILVEDLKTYAEALAYIWRLQPVEAYAALMKYATVLLEHCSENATQLFIDYFTGSFRPKKDALIVQESPVMPEGVGFGAKAASAVQNLAMLIPLPYMNTNTMTTSTAGLQTQTQVVETTNESDYVKYTVPRPRRAFSAFVDHPHQFIIFLEACIDSDGVSEEDKSDLNTTLFELYLHVSNDCSREEKQHWETKATKLLETKDAPIDSSNAILLSDVEKFRDGNVLVSEKQGLHMDIFRSYTTALDTAGAIKALRKYGPEEPQLYPLALSYFTSSPRILNEAGPETDAVLQKIDEDGLMAPLQVIQTLSANSVATLGLVKKYLSATVQKERDEIAANRRLIDSYRNNTIKMQHDIEELNTKPVSFSATRCSTCGMTLDLPTVHFMCKHSYHQRCLNVVEGQEDDLDSVPCPICAPHNQTVKAIRRAQEESSQRNDLFTDSLERSGARFETVSDWFGRGVMSLHSYAEQ